ncbi:PGAP1-like protein [Maribacter dokdonensis]|uniref:PGAP1-like protein n=1 Tax=Maribacter dokdonensis TaxID=320912 RepID=A0ABY0UB55_9FLAO|nr:ABC-three component system protein [Maribacter dokdonensis]SDS37481.1 PGAP1-like protein [Maribacter dokdonensis]
MIKIINQNSNPVNTIAIFIHGFIGNEETWIKQDDSKALIKSLLESEEIKDNLDVGLFLYQTKLLEFFPKLSRLDKTLFKKKKAVKTLPIESIAKILSTQIRYRCAEYENIILVGHSMGGLVAKRFVLDDINENTTSKVKLYISLATPHSGSDLATYGTQIISNAQVKDLAPLSDNIQKLNAEWVQCTSLPKRFYIQGLSDDIVPEASGIALDREKQQPIYSDDDHFSIIVPDNDEDVVVHAIIKELKEFFTKLKIESIENVEEFVDKGQYNNEVFVLKLLLADVHETLIDSSKVAFYSAEFTIRKLTALGVKIEKLVSLYTKIKELYSLEFGDLLSGAHKSPDALFTAVHKRIHSEDKNYLSTLHKPLEALQKFGMLQQLASTDNNIWWAINNNVKDLEEFKEKISKEKDGTK